MVDQSILLKEGAAKFTRNVAVAKKTLNNMNSINPIIIKAKDLTDNNIDVIIEDRDAVTILIQNNETNFLSDAKVVFVVD